MSEGQARSAGARRCTVALVAAFCALAVGPGCDRETFDLLNVAGNTGNAGQAGMAQISAGAAGAADNLGGGGNGNETDGGAGRMSHGGFGGGAGFSQGTGGNPAGCLPGESCASGGSFGVICPPIVSFCERCEAPQDCQDDKDSPYCLSAVGRCVQCRPGAGDCAIDEVCYPLTLSCAHHCQTSAECIDDHNHPLCDPQFGACVTCIKDSNCRPINGHPGYCAFGSCVECDQNNADAPSAATAQCPADKPYCVGLRCQNKPH